MRQSSRHPSHSTTSSRCQGCCLCSPRASTPCILPSRWLSTPRQLNTATAVVHRTPVATTPPCRTKHCRLLPRDQAAGQFAVDFVPASSHHHPDGWGTPEGTGALWLAAEIHHLHPPVAGSCAGAGCAGTSIRQHTSCSPSASTACAAPACSAVPGQAGHTCWAPLGPLTPAVSVAWAAPDRCTCWHLSRASALGFCTAQQ